MVIKSSELEYILKITTGTLIGAGIGYVANETDSISYLIEHFGGKAGTFDSVLEFSIPTIMGLFGGYYLSMKSIFHRYENKIKEK